MRRGGIVLAALAAATVAALVSTRSTHAAFHHAALVIEHASGRMISRCVGFAEEQISGFQLIQRSGIEYQTQNFGAMGNALCQLDGEPSPVPGNCLGTGPYWQYFHRTASGWTQSPLGASTWMLHDGDTDGWHYAPGAGQAPANVSFNAVCGAPATPLPPVVSTAHSAAPTIKRAAGSSGTAAAPLQTTPTPTTTPVEALAPSASATAAVALADTGPPRSSPPRPPIGIWILLAVSVPCLLGIAAINLRRRGP